MPRYTYMRDPYDPDGEPMIVDNQDIIRIYLPNEYCKKCKQEVPREGGQWIWFAQERDYWLCKDCK